MAAGSLSITPERGRADRRAFLGLPYRLYAGHPVWVPPLRMAEAALMNRRKNPFFAHATVEHFLARRGRRVVGRIAAIENRRHNEVHEDRMGFFGFFDVEPDPDAAVALVAAAHAWVAGRGLDPMRGPVNYSMNDSCGVLVEGFDEPPAILMPYNRPDYESLLREAGLVGVKDLLALRLLTTGPVPERMQRVVDRVMERRGISLRKIDLRDFDRELPILLDLYNRSWEKNWGFVPATEAEFRHAATDLKMLLQTDMSAIAERHGVPVGIAIFLHDVNVLLRGSNGRLFPFLWLKLLRGVKKVSQTRSVLLGIVPEARRMAVNEAFFAHATQAAYGAGGGDCEAGWVLEDNHGILSPIHASGGRVSKRYRMYETPPAG